MRWGAALLGSALAFVMAVPRAVGAPREKIYHDLHGTITNVDIRHKEFTLETEPGKTQTCFVDAATKLKRDGNLLKLKEIHPPERAYCHCTNIRDGKHYAAVVLLESKGQKQ